MPLASWFKVIHFEQIQELWEIYIMRELQDDSFIFYDNLSNPILNLPNCL